MWAETRPGGGREEQRNRGETCSLSLNQEQNYDDWFSNVVACSSRIAEWFLPRHKFNQCKNSNSFNRTILIYIL